MVLTSETSHTFPIPFPYIVLAHNQRYPSPYGRHILSSDVISRSFHPETNVLRTTRLVLKRGKVPRWAPRVIQKIDTTWVLEESEIEMGLVEPDGTTPVREAASEGSAPSSSDSASSSSSVPPSGIKRELRTRSRNIDRTEFMEVFEWQVFRPLPEDTLATEVNTLSRVTSEFGFWPVSHRIESFGLSKLPRSIEGARLGLQLVADLILRPSTSSAFLSSGPLKPYQFDPVPSAFTLRIRARLDEARSKWAEQEHGISAEEAELREIQESERAESRRRGWRYGPVVDDEGQDREGAEPRGLKAWRDRWAVTLRQGKNRFRERVCAMTGLLCDAKGPAAAAAAAVGADSGSVPPSSP
ncbi:hypothetical protein JCM10908_002940 [Rhodotorula pacifica]|uniref:uncharacterized protein n=1 Tax=Rhodotorula pacifica TaxID=1495444 RepID=UPI003176167D